MAEVFPRNNLDPAAVPWGRSIENASRGTTHAIQQAGLSAGMQNKQVSGTFHVLKNQSDDLERQVSEILSRGTYVLSLGSRIENLSVPASTSPTNPGYARRQVSWTVNLPKPYDEAPRKAMISISAVGYGNANGIWYATLKAGDIVGHSMTEWGGRVNRDATELHFLLSGQTSFTMVMDVQTTNTPTGGAHTARIGVEDLEVVVTYGEKV